MLVYHSFNQSYKSGEAHRLPNIALQNVKERTSRKNTLTKKNIKFITSLGLKVRKV